MACVGNSDEFHLTGTKDKWVRIVATQIGKVNRVRTCKVINIRINISDIICEPMNDGASICFVCLPLIPSLPFLNIWSDILRQVDRQVSSKPWEKACHGSSLNGRISLLSDLRKLPAISGNVHLFLSCQPFSQIPSAEVLNTYVHTTKMESQWWTLGISGKILKSIG